MYNIYIYILKFIELLCILKNEYILQKLNMNNEILHNHRYNYHVMHANCVNLNCIKK